MLTGGEDSPCFLPNFPKPLAGKQRFFVQAHAWANNQDDPQSGALQQDAESGTIGSDLRSETKVQFPAPTET